MSSNESFKLLSCSEKTMNYIAKQLVNFPNKEFQEIKGYKITKQHFRKVQYEHIEDEQGVISLRTITDDGSDPCLDTVAVKEGFVSITPLQKTSFSIELFKKLNKEEK